MSSQITDTQSAPHGTPDASIRACTLDQILTAAESHLKAYKLSKLPSTNRELLTWPSEIGLKGWAAVVSDLASALYYAPEFESTARPEDLLQGSDLVERWSRCQSDLSKAVRDTVAALKQGQEHPAHRGSELNRTPFRNSLLHALSQKPGGSMTPDAADTKSDSTSIKEAGTACPITKLNCVGDRWTSASDWLNPVQEPIGPANKHDTVEQRQRKSVSHIAHLLFSDEYVHGYSWNGLNPDKVSVQLWRFAYGLSEMDVRLTAFAENIQTWENWLEANEEESSSSEVIAQNEEPVPDLTDLPHQAKQLYRIMEIVQGPDYDLQNATELLGFYEGLLDKEKKLTKRSRWLDLEPAGGGHAKACESLSATKKIIKQYKDCWV